MFNIIVVVYRVDVNELLPLNQLIIAVVSEISFFIEKTVAHCLSAAQGLFTTLIEGRVKFMLSDRT